MSGNSTSDQHSLNYFTCTLGQAAQLAPTKFRTVDELIDKQAVDHGENLACGFPAPRDGDQEWGCELLTFEDLRNCSVAAASELTQTIRSRDTDGSTKCVALLCASSLDFLLTWLGLMRAGIAVLLLAPQCQPEAISHLCQSCDAVFLVYDEAYRELASSAALHSGHLTITPIPWQAEGLATRAFVEKSKTFLSTFKADEADIAYIHHTSGTSSGLPKPISQTHRGGVGVLPSLDGADAATFTTTPLYHGGVADCFRAWTSNALIWLFPANKCPITNKTVLSCLEASSKHASKIMSVPPVKYFSSVPYVLQMLAEDASGVKMLQEMDIVGVGGAALPTKLGDDLVSKGVNLASRFGSAECGLLLSSHRNYESDKDWQYLRLPPTSKELIRFERQSDQSGGLGLHELVVLPEWPHIAKRNRSDGSFATSDLFEPHPTSPNVWRYHSRSDSQITLLTGKKFDPAPIGEEIIPGALIFPKTTASKRQPFLEDEIWGVVTEVNSKGQSHTRLSRNMLLILGPGLPALERSSKGTLLRAAAEMRFSGEIEQVYARLGQEVDRKGISSDQDIKSLVREIVNAVLEEPMLDDHADFYKSGVDSANCTQIRSLLQIRLLPELEPLPWNVVYDCGSIERFAFPHACIWGNRKESHNDEEQMFDLVQQYFLSERFKIVENGDLLEEVDRNSRLVVLLTGTTGALGAHILDTIRHDASVSDIICLVRAPDEKSAKSRVSESLTKRRKNPLSRTDDKIRCIPAHLGSRMSFMPHGMSTSRFHSDPSMTTSPASTTYSTCVLGKNHPLAILETVSSSPADADSLGYSQSKWVAEAICSVASKQEDMAGRIKVLRIGQLTGDADNGVWNMSEAWPMMLSTVELVGCLPRRQDKLSWLPLDVAAQAVVDILLSDTFRENLGESCPVFHVVNNLTETSWMDLLSWIQEIGPRKFDIVNPDVWLEKLEKVEDHPAKNLLWLWKRGSRHGQSEKEEEEEVRFEVGNAVGSSKAMRSVTPVDKTLVKKIWCWLEAEMRKES
ncbi:related to nonribosomal peptide synthetase MxcG [Phialocephala subalpina]|uniref:Related to nonribosomal peptide synthetase MxcG n=1 Tax=Phialocephala subalpina TaxID=576137 RepID=A0A1L7XX79_9HELO|nr:related to nonribosomal peptide synthetase MxcG [Phialocephala subalpina]